MTKQIKQNVYNIGEFSTKIGLTPSTLRYYENEGLIKPNRYENGRRYYTSEDVDWIKFLNHLKGTGMSIEALKQYIIWREKGDVTIPQRLELLKTTKNDFLQKLTEVQHHLQILNDKINWYEEKNTGIISEKENFAEYLQRLGHKE
ncbi:MerR family transcriptional regulator [Weissella paramesenteroides]|uniref:MerR family transcriptional regulator n=1 Tax=Weissella paramesenteroides TaxID=1249 RepID=UPI00123A29A0|nr:MerR family transcriptional regulator [Weissella paramesenteroides]KAA8438319.1 MerR family transcriptional regulator [Weissella paramesenteroides]KAA8440284.1 MerR family transcriptional regulator [Weissella paramesenteroides]KAA8440388.1 MerR family transcriptional regulator [Weissella paramesenteroides]KAA8445128.1 MerR family transcriptional regulator [Weissella paramesenteroides]KAA8448302.1 MerR family transcriptional regulator [Weissella paramesenteroides]